MLDFLDFSGYGIHVDALSSSAIRASRGHEAGSGIL